MRGSERVTLCGDVAGAILGHFPPPVSVPPRVVRPFDFRVRGHGRFRSKWPPTIQLAPFMKEPKALKNPHAGEIPLRPKRNLGVTISLWYSSVALMLSTSALRFSSGPAQPRL